MLWEVSSLLVVLTLGVLAPGPDFLLILKNSIGGSRVRAFATVAGIAAGLLAQLTVIAIGFTVIDAEVIRFVQFGGAAFLAWIGARTLRASWASAADHCDPREPAAASGSAFLEGLGCNVTNPKAFLFYVSMFAHVLPPHAPAGWRVALPLGFAGHAALAWTLVVLALQSPPVAPRLARVQRPITRGFGAALLLLAAWIVVEAW